MCVCNGFAAAFNGYGRTRQAGAFLSPRYCGEACEKLKTKQKEDNTITFSFAQPPSILRNKSGASYDI